MYKGLRSDKGLRVMAAATNVCVIGKYVDVCKHMYTYVYVRLGLRQLMLHAFVILYTCMASEMSCA